MCSVVTLNFSVVINLVSHVCSNTTVHTRSGTRCIYTSVKMNGDVEWGCRDALCEKSWTQGNPLSNTTKDTVLYSR